MFESCLPDKMKKRWKDRYKALSTHDWVEEDSLENKSYFVCSECGYRIEISNLGFVKDFRGVRNQDNMYHLYTCYEYLCAKIVKDIIT